MGYLKLVDAGAHSAGINNSEGYQFVSAKPEFTLNTPLEFTVSGGTAASPQVQHAQSGLIGADTELWLKHAGSDGLTKVTVGGASESGGCSFANTQGSDWTDNNGNAYITWSGNVASLVTSNKSTRKTAAFTGDFAYRINPNSYHTDVGSYIFGCYASAEDASYSWLTLALQGLTDSFWVSIESGQYRVGRGSSTLASGLAAWSSSDVLVLTRSGSTFKLYLNGGLLYTWAASSSATMRCALGMYYASGPQDQATIAIDADTAYGLTTYTLSNISPAQSELPASAYKVRSDASKPMMYLAAGQTDEPLCKETALTLGTCTASQIEVSGSSSLLSYFVSGNLSRDLIVTVGGVDYVVQPNGEVTESGTGPYVTTIPIPAQASAPTAASLADRYTEEVGIESIAYSSGELVVTGEEITLADDPDLKRLALKLRSDITAVQMRARAAKIYTKEMPA